MARLVWHDSYWSGKRTKFITSVALAGVMLIILFLGNMSYLYGAIYHSGDRLSSIHILAVDYDGGIMGQSMILAYKNLEGSQFPTLQFQPATRFPTMQDVRNAVCHGDYWAAIISQPGASLRLSAALGGGPAAANYHANNTLTYVYNAANYATFEVGNVAGSLQALVAATTPAYHTINGSAIQVVNFDDRAAVLSFTDPIQPSVINIMPTSQGTKALYNTVSIVLPIIQQFFFLMALNGINNNFGIYGRLKSSRVGRMRTIISNIYTLLSSLTIAGYIWAFREDWEVTGGQFALTWMTYWLYAHINFLVLDTITAFIPPEYLTFFVLTWVISNVTSTIFPFELNPGFYRWGYALPAHEVFAILMQIWSNGCNNNLHRALPILFAWEVVGIIGSVSGMHYRNHQARKEFLEAELDAVTGDNMAGTQRLRRDHSSVAGPSFAMPFLKGDNRPSNMDV